jgi:peptidoglycan hydrolase-like protein with peptidoglycan-binding domain
MPIIKYPVGRGAYNHRDDVITIQIALSKAKAPNYKTFWPGKIDGRASPEFVDAITIFQHSQRVVANGRIGKNCPTNVRLEKILPKDAKNLAATIGGSKLQTFQSLREEYRDREVFVSGAAIETLPSDSGFRAMKLAIC